MNYLHRALLIIVYFSLSLLVTKMLNMALQILAGLFLKRLELHGERGGTEN